MQRKPILPDLSAIPACFHPLLQDATVYDSSCSPEARVYFIDKDGGYYLKTAPVTTLQHEAEMTAYFQDKGLAPAVLAYHRADADWLLTERVCGEDCTDPMYLADPKRLCDTTATLLRTLHETDFSGCPVQNHTERYLGTVERNYKSGEYDKDSFPDSFGYASAQEAITVVRKYGHLLKNDTLLHGDYCLPNILLNNWHFSKFIDLGNGGVGDRHVDLFWGVWTLFFNLKTNAYAERFLDAYGRDEVETDMLRVVAACEVFG